MSLLMSISILHELSLLLSFSAEWMNGWMNENKNKTKNKNKNTTEWMNQWMNEPFNQSKPRAFTWLDLTRLIHSPPLPSPPLLSTSQSEKKQAIKGHSTTLQLHNSCLHLQLHNLMTPLSAPPPSSPSPIVVRIDYFLWNKRTRSGGEWVGVARADLIFVFGKGS